MKIAELLRNLADVIDQSTQSEQTPSVEIDEETVSAPQNLVTPITIAPADNNGDLAPQRYVPPLQLKIELLKRAVDVNNIYSPNVPDQDGNVPPHQTSLSQGDNNPATAQEQGRVEAQGQDEINQLRRRIAALLQVDGGNDDPIDN